VVTTASFVGGGPLKAFEDEFAAYVGANHCIGVANGTDAIEIVLESLDLPKNGQVIVPAASFIASSEAVSRSGLEVVFADVSEDTHTLDPEDVAARITDRTVGIIAVHLFGHPAPMVALLRVAGEHDLAVIEDCAQAHGAEIGGRRIGALGTAGTFSFYPGKNLGAYGDGGAIATADAALARRVRMLANHGRESKHAHEFEGRNSRLDTLQAAILSAKLKHLDKWTERRRQLADRYRQGLADVGDLVLPSEREDCRHVYHLFVVRTQARDALQKALEKDGISTGIHYPDALPRLKAYRHHPQHAEAFVANRMAREVLSLPMGDSIRPEEVDRVIDSVRHFFDGEVALAGGEIDASRE
jgi:dTDP-4-amino-4,6-dideoxygalactose transaminase